MNIFDGKCVICTENTLVLSGKDKQKFVELLKEHYFDVNQIKNNKFLLQFKEKRAEKSICLSCAYIIESYVSARKKFKERNRDEKKCAICSNESNLTNGSNELINDAYNLLKNVNTDKRIPRIKQICLECCVCIISWNKIIKIITKYTLNEKDDSNAVNGIKKRRHSIEDDVDSESDTLKNDGPPIRITRKMKIEKKKQTAINNESDKDKKSKKNKSPNVTSQNRQICVSNKKKIKLVKEPNDALEKQLKHLSNVSTEILSKDIYLSDKMTSEIMSDDRMMFDIPYIYFENIESMNNNKYNKRATSVTSERKSELLDSNNQSSQSLMKNNKTKRKNISPKSKRQSKVSNSDNQSSDIIENKKRKFTRKTNTEEISTTGNKLLEVISISDSDNEGSSDKRSSIGKIRVRVSSRINKAKSSRYIQEKQMKKLHILQSRVNSCSSCKKTYKKKYHLQLHELEHEASFKPVVVVQKENDTKDKTSSDNKNVEENQNKESQRDNELEKTSSSTQNNSDEKKTQNTVNTDKDEEKEDSDEAQFHEAIKQVVNETLSQLDKDIDENTAKPVEQVNCNQDSSLNKGKEINGHNESSQDEDPLILDDISDGDKIIDKDKENEEEIIIEKGEENCNQNSSVNKDKEINGHNELSQDEDLLNLDDISDGDKIIVEDKENEKEIIIEEDNTNEKTQEDTESINENYETKNEKIQQSTNYKNVVMEKGIDEDRQELENEENEEIKEKNNEDNPENEITHAMEISEATNDSNIDKADTAQCDNKNDENKKDYINNENSAVVKDKDDCDEVTVIDSDENEERKTNNLKSFVIESDSSSSSDKDKEINKDQTVEENNHEAVVIEDNSSNSCDKGEEDVSDKPIKETNSKPLTQYDCPNSSKDEDTDKAIQEKTIKSVEIEDDCSNISDENEEETQNTEDKEKVNNTVDLLITEDSQVGTNDDDASNEGQKTSNSDNIEKKSEEEFEPVGGSDDANSQSSDKTNNSIESGESEMEPLKMSQENVYSSPKKHHKLTDNSKQSTNSDKYDIVESLLQNLGA